MLVNAATIESTSQVVGYKGIDNQLIMKFTPAARLPPNG